MHPNSMFIDSLSTFCHNTLQTALVLWLQVALLLALGLLAGRAVRCAAPEVSGFLYKAVLASVVVSSLIAILLMGHIRPLCNLSLPTPQSTSVTETAPTRSSAASMAGTAPSTTTDIAVRTGDMPIPTTLQPALALSTPGNPSLLGWIYMGLVGLWGAGTVALLMRLLLCQTRVWRMCRRATPGTEAIVGEMATLCTRMGLRVPKLMMSAEAQSPFVCGLWRPALILPTALENESDVQTRRVILAHELMHLQQRDIEWTLLARLACAVGWVQPLLWTLCRRMEQAGEAVCDRAALAQGGAPAAYARCLLALAERFASNRAEQVVGVGMASSPSMLGRRIEQILDDARRSARPLTRRQRVIYLVGLLLAMMPGWFLASAQATSAAQRPTVQNVAPRNAALARIIDNPKPTQADIQAAHRLLREGASIRTRSGRGVTVLMFAARIGDLPLMKAALKGGVDVNARTTEGQTALTWVMVSRNTDAVQVLLRAGADVNAQDEWRRTPLMAAANFAFRGGINLLLSHGADVNARSKGGNTALMNAQGHPGLILLLRQHGARG